MGLCSSGRHNRRMGRDRPVFNFSDTWQLVINTGTTIVTFLMVFLIHNSQNRDAAAIQDKLDELIRVSRAHNSFVGVAVSGKLSVRESLYSDGKSSGTPDHQT